MKTKLFIGIVTLLSFLPLAAGAQSKPTTTTTTHTFHVHTKGNAFLVTTSTTNPSLKHKNWIIKTPLKGVVKTKN